MRLAPGETARFCRQPDLALNGALLHGPDAGLIAMRRRELVAGVLGAEADALEITRVEASAVRRDPAALDTALRARGFFAKRAVVLVDGATDSLAQALGDVLKSATPEDAFLIVSAGLLPARSGLRRFFEGSRHLVALEAAAEAPTIEDIEARLGEFGVRAGLEDEARVLLASLANSSDRLCFDRILENVAIFSLSADAPLTAAEIRLLTPAGLDAELDAFVDAVAGGIPESVGPTFRQVVAAGANAVTLLLGLQRHFRGMAIASGGGGSRMPLWGDRRDVALAQLRRWRHEKLELAGRILYETDARVRSTERVPALALVERCALRLAMMAER